MSSEDAQARMLGCKRSSVVLAEDRTPWVVPAQPPCLACHRLLLQGRRSPSASSSPLTQRKQVGALVVLETEQGGWGEDRHYLSLCPSNHKLGCGAPMLVGVCVCVSLAFLGVFLFWGESVRFRNFVSSRLFLPVAVLLVKLPLFQLSTHTCSLLVERDC